MAAKASQAQSSCNLDQRHAGVTECLLLQRFGAEMFKASQAQSRCMP